MNRAVLFLRGGLNSQRCYRLTTVGQQRFQSESKSMTTGELAAKLGKCSTQALVDALWMKGWPSAMIEGPRPLATGQKVAGAAVTLRFVPARPDIAADKLDGILSPEYQAFEMCGPDQVLVISSVGKWDSVGGDIKFLRLKQRQIGGLVTNGSVRDTNCLLDYGFPVWSHSVTAKQGPAFMQPWGVNEVINMNGTVVRPGDFIIGDDDGVVVVPQSVAEECLQIAEEREEVEDLIKAELKAKPTSPGVYYPFRKPVKPASPLGRLLQKHNVKHHFANMSTSSRSSNMSTSSRSFSTSTKMAQSNMRAAFVSECGDTSAISIGTMAVPDALNDGEVLVKNAYAGVNFIDTYHRSGLYARIMPFILGQEASGVIEKTTPEAKANGMTVGQKVLYSELQTYCEYSKASWKKMLTIPDGVGMEEACVVPVQGLTAHYLVHDAPAGLIKEGEWMLIHAAGGGTGQIAVQIAKAAGYKVIGTCSTGKVDFVKSLGCDFVIDYSTEDVVEKANEATGGAGVKAVLDGVGLSTYEASLDVLGPRGICVFFGNASGAVPAIPPLKLIGKSSYITRPKLNDYTSTRAELVDRTNAVFDLIASKKLRVNIDESFPLANAADAHTYLEAGKSKGKVLISI